jgi:NADH dehydrogenase [ubiquinone] 1 alpha subcomplex assembly factor 5
MLPRATTWRRGFATFSSLQPYTVFDRSLKRIQRDRAALKNNGEESRTVDYLRNEVAERMIERLLVRFCTQYNYIS